MACFCVLNLCQQNTLKKLVPETCTKNLMQVHHFLASKQLFGQSRCTVCVTCRTVFFSEIELCSIVCKILVQEKTCTRLTDTRASFLYKFLVQVCWVCVAHISQARHLHTWLSTFTWSWKVLDVGSAPSPTDHAPFHADTTHFMTDRGFAAAGPRVWNSLPAHLCDEDISDVKLNRSCSSSDDTVLTQQQLAGSLHSFQLWTVKLTWKTEWQWHRNKSVCGVPYQTLTLWHPLLPYGYSYKASCARPG